MTALTGENIAFAFTLLGEAAYDYLRRRYEGEDPRLELALACCDTVNGLEPRRGSRGATKED